MRITLQRFREFSVKIFVTIDLAHGDMCCCTIAVLFFLTAGCEKCDKRNRNIHTAQMKMCQRGHLNTQYVTRHRMKFVTEDIY